MNNLACYHIGRNHRVLVTKIGDRNTPYPFTAYLQSLSGGEWEDRGMEHVACHKEALDELERIVEHDDLMGTVIKAL